MNRLKVYVSLIVIAILLSMSCTKALTKTEISILGTWHGNHEPIQYVFNEDRTYNLGVVDSTGTSEPFETGTWSADNGKLNIIPDTTLYMGSKAFTTEINFVGEILLTEPLPNITSGSVNEYGTLEEYAKEFGFTKAK